MVDKARELGCYDALVVGDLLDAALYDEAFDLIKDLEPTTPQEYILKGVVNASKGQDTNGSREHLKMAQQFFQLVGASASECDTIPGRQCMASCFFSSRSKAATLRYMALRSCKIST